MCGITGFLDLSHQTKKSDLQSMVRQMADTLRHRGPDDNGVWVDAEAGMALGFCRLAIIDLSKEGHQPMCSAQGRYVIVFNGEVYNFQILRQELEALGHAFRGHSDTEVILEAISQWGLEAAVKRFIGMFAFALWDRQEQRLHLVRDRLGIKPLYYGWSGNLFLFGSELKALQAHPGFRGEVNRDALALYLRHSCVPAPYSIYKNIYKLPPGAMFAFSATKPHDVPALSFYWSAREMAEQGAAQPFTGSTDEAATCLKTLLLDAVKLRMIADVPLGAFLSGGIDSSVIVALMQAQSAQPIKTFTIGFYEAGHDEAKAAKAVAHHLGTDHTELYLTPEQALAVIPRLSTLYDEPFADSSQIPTFLVSELARRHVTVSLSGDGGDELFAGYNWYFQGRDLWNAIKWMPRPLRIVGAKMLTGVPSPAWETLFQRLSPVLPPQIKRWPKPGDKLHRLANILAVDCAETMYLKITTSRWKEPSRLLLNGHEAPTAFTDHGRWAKLPSPVQRMMYLDTVAYLPDDILTKVDRASMGVSLEARVPLLDHRLVEFAWQLPLSMKIRNEQSKWLLRQVLYKYVPRHLIERPKQGFTVPIESWLRGPLRDWAESLLDRRRLQREGFFNSEPIQQMWAEHLSGERNWQQQLWDVLMFQAWLEEWGRKTKEPNRGNLC
jgi:asparagine synthase (glutamine-hydrolysing)